MFREPIQKGPAFLIRFAKNGAKRDLMFVLRDTQLDHLMKTADAIRQISIQYRDWKVSTASIRDAAFPRHEIGDPEPGYFCFDIRYFYSAAPDGGIMVHDQLLGRIVQRLLSGTPGKDFIQKSGIARGVRYFDRPDVRWELLNEAGKNRWLLLEAIRRFGKTTFMVNLEDQQPEDFIAVYVSLEAGVSQDYFAWAMLAHALSNSTIWDLIPADVKAGLESTWSAGEILDKLNSNQGSPSEKLNELWVACSHAKVRILFLLDEVVIYLKNVLNSVFGNQPQQQEKWKHWVRDVFAILNGAPDAVRFLMAGSMHLPVFLEAREVGLDIPDRMKSISLSPVPREEIETFLRLCLLQEEILAEEEEIQWIVGKFGGWIPSFLMYFVDLLGMDCRDKEALSLKDIQSTYTSLFESRHRHLFYDLDEQPKRYNEFFNPSLSFTHRLQAMLVKAASQNVSLEELTSAFHQARDYDSSMSHDKRERLANQAIRIVEQDFSLQIDDDHCTIACPFLSDWMLSRKQEWGV
jgi:hypothetical protein